MLKTENLLAVKALVWLTGLGTAYCLAGFIYPHITEVAAGPVGWNLAPSPVFNWQVFWKTAVAILVLVPVLSAAGKKWLYAVAELVLLGGMLLLAVKTGESFAGEQPLSGASGWLEEAKEFLGSDKKMVDTYDAGGFLLIFAGCFVAWLVVMKIASLLENKKLTSPSGLLEVLLLTMGAAAFLLYVVGLHKPAFHTTQVWIMEKDVSLYASVNVFFSKGESFIGTLIVIFTFVFPLVKFMGMYWALLAPPSGIALTVNKVLGWLGKWSMLDVFVVALLLVNMKLDSGLLDMELRSGMVYFAVSILLTMVTTAVLVLEGWRKEKDA